MVSAIDSVGSRWREEAQAKARLVVAVVGSLIVVGGGMAWTWRIGQESGRYYHELYHAHAELQGLQRAASPATVHTEVVR